MPTNLNVNYLKDLTNFPFILLVNTVLLKVFDLILCGNPMLLNLMNFVTKTMQKSAVLNANQMATVMFVFLCSEMLLYTN